MTSTKPTINLTDDNWADYFSHEYPASLVDGFEVPEDGIDRDDPIVTRLLAWLARESGRSKDARYEMTRHDAAVLLERRAIRSLPNAVARRGVARPDRRACVGPDRLRPAGRSALLTQVDLDDPQCYSSDLNGPFCTVRQGAVLMPGRPRGAPRATFRVITMGNE